MKHPTVGVYTKTFWYYFENFQNLNIKQDCVTFDDYDLFVSSEVKNKIALLHVMFPSDDDWFENFKKELLELQKICKHVIVLAAEVHFNVVELFKNLDYDNITYYVCGALNFTLNRATVKQYIDFFHTTTFFYKEYLPEILLRLQPYNEKENYFDALLGLKKPHRDVVYNYFSNHLGNNVVTYFKECKIPIQHICDKTKWILETESGVDLGSAYYTASHVKYYGHLMQLSKVIPINVYNATAYSIIAETNCFNDFVFYTEKTAKPIIAKRLFVMFAGINYLENLKKAGFQTFHGIIDESYDSVIDDETRWHMALEQVDWLIKQPQKDILNRIAPILEHNFNHIMNTNWEKNFLFELEKDIVHIIDR